MNDLFPLAEGHDAGGKVVRRWSAGSVVRAVFGGVNDCYRYELSEIWDANRPLVMFGMMNPSMAGVQFSDPTLARTGAFTRSWRTSPDGGTFGGQLIGNVHAYRATDKRRLLEVDDPYGPENTAALLSMASRADLVILAYGQPPGQLQHRGKVVARMLIDAGHDVRVLALNKDLTPKHPLYVSGGSVPYNSPTFRSSLGYD